MAARRRILQRHASSDPTSVLAKFLTECQGQRRWIVADRLQADAAARRLVDIAPGLLAPGVKPLYQAADAALAQAPELLRPISVVQQHRLIEELLLAGSRSSLLRKAASTSGGLAYVADAFRQFAHAGLTIESLLELAATRREQRTEELARAFAQYTQLLSRRRLADRETRLRIACQHLESNKQSTAWSGRVAVSGIDSPSPLELRFLLALLARADEFTIAITLHNAQPERVSHLPSPWLSPQRFHDRLVELWPDAEVEKLDSDKQQDDSCRIAAERLFAGDPHQGAKTVSGAPPALRVTPAASAQEEVESAVRWAKARLLHGTKPNDIVIATRQLKEQGPRLREACAKHGVPLAVEGARPLASAAAARAIARLLRLASEDWRYADVLSLATLPQFRIFSSPIEDASQLALCRRLGLSGRRAAIEWALREVLCPHGRESLLRQIHWHADRFTESEATARHDPDDAIDRLRDRLGYSAALALGPLEVLSEVCLSLSTPATPLGWFDRLDRALKRLGFFSAIGHATEDEAAIAALEDSLSGLTKLNQWLDNDDAELELTEVERLVRAWLPRVSLELPWQSEGRVLALTAESAAGLKPDHLIVIGLGEQSFPRHDADPLLPGEDQTRRAHSDEMLLFTKLLGAARVGTTLSYTAVDEKAQKLNPSSYLSELEQLFAPGSLRTESSNTGSMSLADLRRAAVEGLSQSDPTPMGKLLSSREHAESGRALGAGLIAIGERARGDCFGAYEGMLSELAAAAIEQRFGPQHHWSASQLEQYAICPFKFYLRNVLRIDPQESLQLEVDYRRRGSLLHDAVARFHQRVNELAAEGETAGTIHPETFAETFRSAVNEACEAIAAAPHERAVAAVEAMQATAWSERYQRQHADYDSKSAAFDEPPRPAHFEARFGPKVSLAETSSDPLSTPEPFSFQTSDELVLLTGQVDRIDVGRVNGRLVFNVIDYKTSKQMKVNQEEIESGRLLQLVLYTIAVGDHLFAGQDAAPWQTGYWLVQEKGFKTGKAPQPGELVEGQVVLGDQWQTLVENVRQKVGHIVHSVRAARFPMLNEKEDCTGQCEYRTVCRVAQTRSLSKRLPESEADA